MPFDDCRGDADVELYPTLFVTSYLVWVEQNRCKVKREGGSKFKSNIQLETLERGGGARQWGLSEQCGAAGAWRARVRRSCTYIIHKPSHKHISTVRMYRVFVGLVRLGAGR